MQIGKAEGLLCAVLADGIGSGEHSEIAAQAAVEGTIAWFQSNLENLTSENLTGIISKELIPYLQDRIREAAREAGQTEPDQNCNCNLAFAAILTGIDRIVWGQLGDCAVCLVFQKDGAGVSRVYTAKAGNAFATDTVLSPDAAEKLKVQSLPLSNPRTVAILLTSDGMDGEVYYKGGTWGLQAMQKYLDVMYDDFPKRNLKRCFQELVERDSSYDDDLSMAILSRAEEPIVLKPDPTWRCICGHRNPMQVITCQKCGEDFLELYSQYKQERNNFDFFSHLNDCPEEEERILNESRMRLEGRGYLPAQYLLPEEPELAQPPEVPDIWKQDGDVPEKYYGEQSDSEDSCSGRNSPGMTQYGPKPQAGDQESCSALPEPEPTWQTALLPVGSPAKPDIRIPDDGDPGEKSMPVPVRKQKPAPARSKPKQTPVRRSLSGGAEEAGRRRIDELENQMLSGNTAWEKQIAEARKATRMAQVSRKDEKTGTDQEDLWIPNRQDQLQEPDIGDPVPESKPHSGAAGILFPLLSACMGLVLGIGIWYQSRAISAEELLKPSEIYYYSEEDPQALQDGILSRNGFCFVGSFSGDRREGTFLAVEEQNSQNYAVVRYEHDHLQEILQVCLDSKVHKVNRTESKSKLELSGRPGERKSISVPPHHPVYAVEEPVQTEDGQNWILLIDAEGTWFGWCPENKLKSESSRVENP